MTPTFDFAAFLNSPAGNDGPTNYSVPGPPATSTSLSNNFDEIFDGTNFLPDWASSVAKVPEQDEEDTTMNMLPIQGDAPGSSYRSSIAAHHYTQLQHCLPHIGGATGRQSTEGSYSAPSVSLSQASRPFKAANELTIQERRRLSRRSQTSASVTRSTNDTKHAAQKKSSLINSQSFPAPAITSSPVQYNSPGRESIQRAYSASGFDMIGALLKVAQRPNPKIDIGPLDLSCSFTVSDAQHPDQPIIHCSNSFCELTGYSRDEIIGRNCRFLQAPDGQVQEGSERVHTDNGAVKHFKKHCSQIQECQASLINYRRDGTPFINLVTVVPITWGDSKEPVFMVGFQVDLVEHPGAVLERSNNGLYVVNYSNDFQSKPEVSSQAKTVEPLISVASPAKTMDDEEEASKRAMVAQELAELISNGSSKTTKWARVLLENSNDLIHVLSLKGTFLYVSPSVERLLGYKAEEMVGKSISEFCHPSDVVPVFRELKDSTSNASIAAAARHWARVDGTVNPPTKGGAGQTGPQVNLVMRMKHKTQGHEWIENVGKLHLEQGKGRKVVISTGRRRPVYNLPWDQAVRSLENKGPDFWSKMSQEGLILSTSGTVADVLDSSLSSRANNKVDTSLAGMHLRDVVDGPAFAALQHGLRSLEVSGIPHLMNNGMGGTPVTVMSTLIPSSAGGEGLPTVFVHTQRVNSADLGQMQLNMIHQQSTNYRSKLDDEAPNSVFGELSTHQSSSWVFELHQLKIANKKLREEIRGHQRRISDSRPILQVIPPPHSPSKPKVTSSSATLLKTTKTPTSQQYLPILNFKNNVSSSGSVSDNSIDTRLSPFDRDQFGSGSGSDATAATSVHNTPNPIRAGTKRSRC